MCLSFISPLWFAQGNAAKSCSYSGHLFRAKALQWRILSFAASSSVQLLHQSEPQERSLHSWAMLNHAFYQSLQKPTCQSFKHISVRVTGQKKAWKRVMKKVRKQRNGHRKLNITNYYMFYFILSHNYEIKLWKRVKNLIKKLKCWQNIYFFT